MAARIKRKASVTELPGGSDKDKFAALCQIPVYSQAKWFLKCFWDREPLKISAAPDVAEHIYEAAFDLKRRCGKMECKGECELDQLGAHHFLEKVDAAITYKDFKAKFKDLDLDFNNKLSLTEYLVYKYLVGHGESLIPTLVNSKQAVIAGLGAAEAELEECQTDYEAMQEAHEEVVKIMQKIEQMKVNHTMKANKIEKKIIKHEGKTVKQNIEKKKLEVHMNEHPVDNKMEITQKAAVRKSKKATNKLEKNLEKAKKMVEDIRSSGTTAHASLWWMERNLKEMEKTMSKKAYARKQAAINKKKAAADAGAMAALGAK